MLDKVADAWVIYTKYFFGAPKKRRVDCGLAIFGGLEPKKSRLTRLVMIGKGVKSDMEQCLNSHYFHIIGDGHQPNSRGLYTHYKDSY